MVWKDFNPKQLSKEALRARIEALTWTSWKPTGIVLHNTAAPTLAQWAEAGPRHDARIQNLENYYEGLGWNGGPHWFVSRDWFDEFNNPLRRGTHSPSFNATHFGIEMVGNYDKEDFNSGGGAQVRDNAVYLMALLCKKFNWDPARVIKFHKEDPKTTHDCPGKKVVKADIIARVKQELAKLNKVPTPPTRVDPSLHFTKIYATEFGGKGDAQESAYGGKVNPSEFEVALPFRFRDGRRRYVRVFRGAKSIVCKVNDVGPWNITDNYWDGTGRPRAETQAQLRQRADNGRVPSNPAGIDLTPAVMDELDVPGRTGTRSTTVDWMFTTELTNPVIPEVGPLVDKDQDSPTALVVPAEPIQPESLPHDADVAKPTTDGRDNPMEPPNPPRIGFWSKIWGGVGTAFASIGGFIYDYRVALVMVGALFVLFGFIYFVNREQVNKLVSSILKQANDEIE
jgi:hypothetical protein